MSASDSDYSIDWLASDDEENDSELEPDCGRLTGETTTLPTSLSPGETRGSCTQQQLSKRSGDDSREAKREEKERVSGMSDGSSCGSPSSYTGSCDSEDQRSWASVDPKGKQWKGQKRTQSTAFPEQRESEITLNQTEKDKLFACKCVELQCYIQPLSLILNGLRAGRYRERLSSFQESVAMDRIQRIMGVLQNPCMGERYVNIILKMEEMLKSWFPHVKPREQPRAVDQTLGSTPTKKQKLSTAASSPPNGVVTPSTVSAPLLGTKALRVSDLTPPGPYSATNLKWLHTSPICSPSAERAQGTIRNLLTASSDKDVTQDSAVSSSTDDAHLKTDLAPSRPPLGKISAPCLERLLKSTESIITRKGPGDLVGSGWS
ncbi:uncharacterized protein ciartb [Chanos chanos]|uniref:Uncharacterized protein LOC115830229 n=1 Tax=Chanos chanos TaxID=29144 RepID=A0A6J2X0Q0_CHACN|nr:uncharacterized protein LOC115830229 [Chanos chanos]XP_030650194.1 uncharacterized protein LOC115830229 [Chanos chanos]